MPLTGVLTVLENRGAVGLYAEPQPYDPTDPESNDCDFALCPADRIGDMLRHKVLFYFNFSVTDRDRDAIETAKEQVQAHAGGPIDGQYLTILSHSPQPGAQLTLGGVADLSCDPFTLEDMYLNFFW